MTRALAIACVLAGAASTAAADPAPHDFTSDAQALWAVAACGTSAVPAGFDKDVVAAHCKVVNAEVATWRSKFKDKAAPFFAKHATGGPAKVVYPFGGGDLITALVVYPDATEYTTLSLEGMGDPRTLAATGKGKLAGKLSRLRDTLEVTFGWAWNTTIQLSIDSSESGSALPGILTSALVALNANGYEPLEVRFFSLDKGAIKYVTDADVDAWDKAAKSRDGGHKQTNAAQVGLFDDVEIVFRKAGDASAPKKIFRHVTSDLSDDALASHPDALTYVSHLGKVSAMTKAASYLLWKPAFGKLRDALLAQAPLVVSDDTGIPPKYGSATYDYEVWGVYKGSHFDFADQKVAKEMVELWKSKANQGSLDFRFGYYDNADHPHVMIARKKP
jgi:hypothetical protein